MRAFYRMNDSDPSGVFPIEEAEAAEWNRKGFGIFWSVQEFNSSVRKKENLKRITAWAVDIDGGEKAEQWERIARAPIVPSLVVESKNGFHVYFNAKDAIPEHYAEIVQDRLIPYFKADPKAKDLARILRVPGFYHMKNPADPYMVTKRFEHRCSYTEKQIEYFFRTTEEEEKQIKAKRELRVAFKCDGDDFWEKIYNLNCEQALMRLSGTHAVNNEIFTFKRMSNGNKNLFVDRKGTSCWIDSHGRIGSCDKGGPTIWNWLRWYGRDNKQTYQLIKEFFPELWT